MEWWYIIMEIAMKDLGSMDKEMGMEYINFWMGMFTAGIGSVLRYNNNLKIIKKMAWGVWIK